MNKIIQVSSKLVEKKDDSKCRILLYSTKIISDVTFSVSFILCVQYYYFKYILFKFDKA